MDDPTLQQFRKQLARWIGDAMENRHLPFRKLSLDLPVVTGVRQQRADLVLWINRPSLITGSIILLPSRLTEDILQAGKDLARAMGITHFVTWEARRVRIWACREDCIAEHADLPLPAARMAEPEDFQNTLGQLLAELKLLAVTTALQANELPDDYYLNLCLMARRDIQPLIAARVRRTAGTEGSDRWIEEAPLATTWLVLWRTLLLLHHHRMPPGMQPERLEHLLAYALSDLAESHLLKLQKSPEEPEIGAQAAVRLYHLANRMKQLGWPAEAGQTRALLQGLLPILAEELDMAPAETSSGSDFPQLLINVHPPLGRMPAVLSAARPFLAGFSFFQAITETAIHTELIEEIPDLPPRGGSFPIMAQVLSVYSPLRTERQRRHLQLRQVWPNRRFELSAETPTYIWNAIHIMGIQTLPGELDLILPADWPFAAGAEILWSLATERYELRELVLLPERRQQLRLSATGGETVTVHGLDQAEQRSLPADLVYGEPPGFLNLALHAPPEVRELLAEGRLRPTGGTCPEWAKDLAEGVARFARTSLGRALWHLCGGPKPPPASRKDLAERVIAAGMPLPERPVLVTLEQIDNLADEQAPGGERLDRELHRLLGPRADIGVAGTERVLPQATSRKPGTAEQITAQIFRDGCPVFPDHYLMEFYRPALRTFQIPGPLQLKETFFGVFLLSGPDDFELEVENTIQAESLVLASHGGKAQIDLPSDDEVGRTILDRYRGDLQNLWHELQAACRIQVPRRQAAASLARRIWRGQKLPPPELFEA